MQGRLDAIDGRTITLTLDTEIAFKVGDAVDVEIKKHREKRSLNANAYFHTLVDKYRQALRIGFSEVKNDLITQYGQIAYMGGEQVIIKTNIPADKMRSSEALHCLCVKADTEDGTDVYFYRVYRGTHTYNSQEMAQLIDGTIREIKANAPEIETMTPGELMRLEGYEKYANGH